MYTAGSTCDSSYLFPQESCEIFWDQRWQYQISIQELDLGSKSWIAKSWRLGCTMESHLGFHEIWAAPFCISQWDAKWWHPTELWRRGSYGGVMTQISLGTTVYVLPLSPVSFSFVFSLHSCVNKPRIELRIFCNVSYYWAEFPPLGGPPSFPSAEAYLGAEPKWESSSQTRNKIVHCISFVSSL